MQGVEDAKDQVAFLVQHLAVADHHACQKIGHGMLERGRRDRGAIALGGRHRRYALTAIAFERGFALAAEEPAHENGTLTAAVGNQLKALRFAAIGAVEQAVFEMGVQIHHDLSRVPRI